MVQAASRYRRGVLLCKVTLRIAIGLIKADIAVNFNFRSDSEDTHWYLTFTSRKSTVRYFFENKKVINNPYRMYFYILFIIVSPTPQDITY